MRLFLFYKVSFQGHRRVISDNILPVLYHLKDWAAYKEDRPAAGPVHVCL